MSYITFKTIGESGNLGSQLQQFASLYAVAKSTGKQIVFPESSLSAGYGFKFAELVDVSVAVAADRFFNDFVDVRPNDGVLVDLSLFNLEPDKNYNIVNRFDSYQYWHPNYMEDILSWNWNSQHYNSAKSLYNSIYIQGKETVAIHVRRGDYLLPQHDQFCRLDVDYYSEALSPFFEDIDRYQFLVFSNDIQWCRDNLIESSSIVSFIEPGIDYVDLICMSLCNHQIIANSSYSWWAAYRNINPSKKVTCPTNYLKNHSPWSHLNGSYYPKQWLNINNNAI